MEKSELRNKVLQHFFTIKDGVPVSELLSSLYFIPCAWNGLHKRLETNIKYFDSYSTLQACKTVVRNGRTYLVIKLNHLKYVIIDYETMDNISKINLLTDFDKNFFVECFNEKINEAEKIYSILYDVVPYEGDTHELMHFYLKNQKAFELTPQIKYIIKSSDVKSMLYIDLINGRNQIAFKYEDSTTTDRIFLSYDLTLFSLQDALPRADILKINSLLKNIPNIIIPIDIIPNDLYEQYINQTNDRENMSSSRK